MSFVVACCGGGIASCVHMCVLEEVCWSGDGWALLADVPWVILGPRMHVHFLVCACGSVCVGFGMCRGLTVHMSCDCTYGLHVAYLETSGCGD